MFNILSNAIWLDGSFPACVHASTKVADTPTHQLFLLDHVLIFTFSLHLRNNPKPYSKLLGRNVVYIPRITLNHATSHDVGSLQTDLMSLTL